jgi:hypothetical protein
VCDAQARFERQVDDVEARGGQANLWWVPITYTSQPELDFSSTYPRIWLDPALKQTTLTDMPGPEHWVLFNVQAAGKRPTELPLVFHSNSSFIKDMKIPRTVNLLNRRNINYCPEPSYLKPTNHPTKKGGACAKRKTTTLASVHLLTYSVALQVL